MQSPLEIAVGRRKLKQGMGGNMMSSAPAPAPQPAAPQLPNAPTQYAHMHSVIPNSMLPDDRHTRQGEPGAMRGGLQRSRPALRGASYPNSLTSRGMGPR